MDKRLQVNIRVEPELVTKIRARFWETAPKHKMSYNAWLVQLLEREAKKGEKNNA